MFKSKVIAAVRSEIEFKNALNAENDVIFFLSPNILTLPKLLKLAHDNKKKVFVHIDLMEGIGKDKSGIKLLKKMEIDGIISTRVNIIRLAKEENIFTVQRFFIVDSKSVETTAEAVKQSKCDVIEVMPGVVPKVIKGLCEKLSVPVIAGGLIESEREIDAALRSGAIAISTGKSEFWSLKGEEVQ